MRRSAGRALLVLALVAQAAAFGDGGDAQVLLQASVTADDDTPLWYPFAPSAEGEGDVTLDAPRHAPSAASSCLEVVPMLGTMKSDSKLKSVLDSLNYLQGEARLEGDVVEAGVAEGGGVLPVLFYLACLGRLEGRTLHLFDTWQGLPPPEASEDRVFGKGMYLRTFEAFMANARKYETAYKQKVATKSFADGAPLRTWNEVWSHVHIVKGLFADTMPGALSRSRVAFLMCDGDMYGSTMDCLKAGAPRMLPGGSVYVDDYYTFYPCYAATRDFLSESRASGTSYGEVRVVSHEGPYNLYNEASQCTPPLEGERLRFDHGTCSGWQCEACLFNVTRG
uniref:Uncharacterized protein n=1 Tax=Alexandrium catenella TaxID=2925 RepID=A0A7S1QB73_ALECA|mmetsp:Transcript_23965/g.65318  ORF Transcript_23965/g.65318 Transcript_23965/m.65318 type:complete len:337 (+) Transcript_23965:74-1084(+)